MSDAQDTAPLPSLESLSQARRCQLEPEAQADLSEGLWGLALSGGGIRSATFCFGLLKALGQNKLFHRFDLLSTVSGGGYIGATLGKLFQNARHSGQSPQAIEAALGEADRRWFAYWLRANGRYLIPRGSKDLMFAAANFGRNLVGVHIELALMSLLLGGLLVGLDLLMWGWADCLFRGRGACPRPGWITPDTLAALANWPTLWLLLPPVVWVGATVAAAYWALPAKPGQNLTLQRWLMAALCAASTVWLLRFWGDSQQAQAATSLATAQLQLPTALVLVAAGVLMAWVVGTLLAWRLCRKNPPDRCRNQLTGALALCLQIGLLITGLGLVDALAWLLATAGQHHPGLIGQFGLALGLAVVGLRAVLPKIADLPRSLTPGTRMNLMGVINLAGMAVLTLLLVFWVSVVHSNATLALFDEQRRLLQFSLSWQWLALMVLPPALLVAVSFRNREFLNRSSLFAFYRARLVRSYLGAANAGRFQAGTPDATAPYPRMSAASGPQVAVQDVHPGDDVPMAEYQPHTSGGPVHLINVCVNQTRDPRGGLFNQDRKGLLMTVGPQGRVRVGQDDWRAVDAEGSLSLGSWMAISGAAVAPGLGGSTRPGLAALLTLAGIRLGYWWDSTALARPSTANGGQALPPVTGKYGQLLAELRGRFDGDQKRDWFLSDGGHFENTAAYALLREECRLIVVADCGADPRYAFGDLENLVRKARIDLQADITFLKPKLPADATAPRAPSAFGSLNDLVSAESHACLALARVHYARSGKCGHLIIVKPNMCQSVPVDLVNFKADNPLFPQEPTTDQFFSEAQWESYFQLGHTLGSQLDAKFMRRIADHAATLFDDDDGSVLSLDASGKAQSVAAPKRLPSRIAATGAVTASISIGALATLGATAWQAMDGQLQAMDKARKMDPAVLKELTDLYGKLAPGLPDKDGKVDANASKDTRLGEMATALLRISDAACTGSNTQAFKQSQLLQMMLSNTKQSCAASRPKHPACEVLLNDDEVVSCLRVQTRSSCVPQYWIRDYDIQERSRMNCPPPVWQAPASAPTASAGVPEPEAQEQVESMLGLPAMLGNLWDWLWGRNATLPTSVPAPTPAPSPAPAASAAARPDPAASEPDTGATSPVVQPSASADPLCKGKTVYIQIFGPEQRDRVRGWREPWRALGANVPPVEDVWDSARRAGRTPPKAPAQPSVIYHDSASLACAQALVPSGSKQPWLVQPLSARLTGSPGVIEVWIPPQAVLGEGAPRAE